jgi:hypothetical protein
MAMLTRRVVLAAGSLVGALVLVATSAPVALRAQGAERHVLRGADVAVYDLAGRVRVVPGEGPDVVVEATRGGRDGGRLRFEAGSVDGREALRVVFPGDRVVYPAMGDGTRLRTRVRGDGTFSGMRGDEVEVRASGDGLEAWADLVVRVPRGRRVAVYVGAGATEARDVDADLRLDSQAASVLAERTRGRLVVDAGSGRTQVRGVEGELTVDAGSGAVELDGVRARRLSVDGGSGALRGRDVRADEIDLDLGSGRTELSGVQTRTLRLDSGSGSVDVGFAADVDDVRIDSGSGSVTLRVPPQLGAALEVTTGSGGITTDIPVTITRRDRDGLRGRIGDGRGRIVIDSGSGAVRLLGS